MTRTYADWSRRAERAGYDGDIADLIQEDNERRAEQQRAEREWRKEAS